MGTSVWPGCQSARAQGGGKSFRFIAVNDFHHATAECNPWFEALVRHMRGQVGVEFVLSIGDQADDAKPASHMAIRDHFRGLGFPVHYQVGNHDVRSASDRSSYEAAYPNSLNYTFEHRGWQFVGFDSTQGPDYDKTRIQAEPIQFLDTALPRLDRGRPTVVFTHFPLGSGAKMRPLNADAVLERLVDFNLQGVFSGHYHAYTTTAHRGIELVTNRCCSRLRGNHDGSKEKGYWLVTCADGKVAREFVAFSGT